MTATSPTYGNSGTRVSGSSGMAAITGSAYGGTGYGWYVGESIVADTEQVYQADWLLEGFHVDPPNDTNTAVIPPR